MAEIVTNIPLTYREEDGDLISPIKGKPTTVSEAMATSLKASGLAEDYSGGGGGSSDISTAEVTIINNCVSSSVTFFGCITTESPIPQIPSQSEPSINVDARSTKTVNVILYKENASSFIEYDPQQADSPIVSVSGNAEADENNVYITGDCTITVTDA